MRKHTIRLFNDGENWMAVNSDPEVRELFGTDTIPTAFIAKVDSVVVLKSIMELNPDRMVSLILL